MTRAHSIIRFARGFIIPQYSHPPLLKALSDFHLILWKFILINFTLVELENKRFIADNVWNAAIRRYLSKANTLTYRVGDLTRRAEANLHELNLKQVNELLSPLGTIDSRGSITWVDEFARHAAEVDKLISCLSPSACSISSIYTPPIPL